MADHILLVEPDTKLRGQLAKFLATRSFAVTEASSVGAALAALQRMQPAVTLVNVPLDEDAATVAFALAANAPASALVAMGTDEAITDFKLALAGEVRIDGALNKPFTARQLAEGVQLALEEKRAKIRSSRAQQAASARLDDDVGALASALAQVHGRPAELAADPPDLDWDALQADGVDLSQSGTSVNTSPGEFEALETDVGIELDAFAESSVPEGLLDPPEDPPELDDFVDDSLSGSLTAASFTELTALEADAGEQAPLRQQGDFKEQLNRFALSPLEPKAPHDPVGIYGPVTMPELLFNCFRDLFSGRLVIRRGEIEKTILVLNGRPVRASSNVRSETLGALLLKAGTISAEQLADSISRVERGGMQQGEALKAIGAIDDPVLRKALKTQVRARLIACFRWTGSSYGLTYDPEVAAGLEKFELNPLVLIFEGIRSGFPIAPLVAHYDNYVRRYVKVTPRLADYATMLRDYNDELQLAGLCDGSRTLGEIIAESPFGLVGTLRIVRAMEAMSGLHFGENRPLPRLGASVSTGPGRVPHRPSAGMRRVQRSTAPVDASGFKAPRRTRRSTGSIIPPHQPATQRPTSRRATSGPNPREAAGEPRRRATGTHPAARAQASAGPAAIRNTGSFRKVTNPSTRPASSRHADRPTSAPPAPKLSPAEALMALFDRIEGAETFYAVLGVSERASIRAIKDAAARAVRGLNRDRVAEIDPSLDARARQAAQKVGEALQTLGDRRQREAYDAVHLPPPAMAEGIDLVQAESNFNKGRVCARQGLLENAAIYFTVAADQDPHQAAYRVYREWAKFNAVEPADRRTRGQAIEEAKAALEATTGHDEACVLVAEMHLAHQSPDAAMRYFNRALDLNSGNVRAREGLAAIERGEQLAEQDDPKKAGVFGKLFSRR